jgi:nucleotide-binding universal stress UspA family protein
MPGRVVVGVDGSEQSRAALQVAKQEAIWRDAVLDVVLAWRHPYTTFVPSFDLPAIEELEGAGRSTLLDLMAGAGLSETGRPAANAIPVEGPAASVLVDAAKGAELLVVGARGVGAFRGMLLGSVSQHCVTHAPCSVLVVRNTPDE